MGQPYNRRRQTPLRGRLHTEGTAAEAVLWTRLCRRQLHGRKFRRQFGVGPYVLDFYCPAERLAVELDGSSHDGPERRAYDAERTAHLGTVGIRVVRFENLSVFHDAAGVLAETAKRFGGVDG